MPQRTREYQHRCAWRAQLALRGTAWRTDAVYALHLLVVFPDRRRRDLSNVVKSVEDGLNGVVWADDSQIAELHVVRDYSKDSPRVEVRVELLSIPGQA
jgi:Holliday junction resolvase RusA-like endonuclease